jgi:hypothetical protein
MSSIVQLCGVIQVATMQHYALSTPAIDDVFDVVALQLRVPEKMCSGSRNSRN